MEAVNHIHLKHTRRIKIFNGKLECRFLKYQMYEGSKKISKKKRLIKSLFLILFYA